MLMREDLLQRDTLIRYVLDEQHLAEESHAHALQPEVAPSEDEDGGFSDAQKHAYPESLLTLKEDVVNAITEQLGKQRLTDSAGSAPVSAMLASTPRMQANIESWVTPFSQPYAPPPNWLPPPPFNYPPPPTPPYGSHSLQHAAHYAAQFMPQYAPFYSPLPSSRYPSPYLPPFPPRPPSFVPSASPYMPFAAPPFYMPAHHSLCATGTVRPPAASPSRLRASSPATVASSASSNSDSLVPPAMQSGRGPPPALYLPNVPLVRSDGKRGLRANGWRDIIELWDVGVPDSVPPLKEWDADWFRDPTFRASFAAKYHDRKVVALEFIERSVFAMPSLLEENLLTSVPCRFERDEVKFLAAYGTHCVAGHSALLRAIQCARIKRGESHARNSKYGTPAEREQRSASSVSSFLPSETDD